MEEERKENHGEFIEITAKPENDTIRYDPYRAMRTYTAAARENNNNPSIQLLFSLPRPPSHQEQIRRGQMEEGEEEVRSNGMQNEKKGREGKKMFYEGKSK